VVPGVPVSIAAPAYAGIPITYPGGGDSVTLVRGYEDHGTRDAAVDWASLARLDGTIVSYASPDQIQRMVGHLMEHGRSPHDLAAIVSLGTLPTQTTFVGTLEDIASGAGHSPGDLQPAVLIIGRVVGLREHLQWFDARPLFGKRILVTRPRDQAAELIERLEAMGAQAIEAPMIRILEPDDDGPLEAAVRRAVSFDLIAFTSGHAVDAFMTRLLAVAHDVRELKGVKLCAVGPATAERLARYGLKVDIVAAEFRAESLSRAMSSHGEIRGMRVLLPRADIGREVVAEELRRQGADVTEVIAYRTVVEDLDREGGPDVYHMLLERRIDVVTFTSASAVRNFVNALGAEEAVDLLRPTVVASIGPVTAEAATQSQIETTIMPAQYTVAGARGRHRGILP